MFDVVQPKCPGSKSITQRALIIAALSEQPVTIEGALVCDDSRYLSAVLRGLGLTVNWNGTTVEVLPAPLRAQDDQPLFVGNAGTTMRFASCLSLLTEGALVLDGDARMRERPIGPLADALTGLGVDVRYMGHDGFPPIALQRGDTIRDDVAIDASLSSQFASGLMLVAPKLSTGLTLRLRGDVVSMPYLDMTGSMMLQAGIIMTKDGGDIRIEPGKYQLDRICVEPDWSAAAFLLGAAEIARCKVVVQGLVAPRDSLQGDAAFVSQLEALRKPQTHRISLRDAPDLIAPLAAVALFAAHPTEICDVAHARVKECDRIAVLSTQLRRIGAVIDEREDGMTVHPLTDPVREPVCLDPANDHRMAMAFGLASLRVAGITVTDPQCVSKSFPDFWEQLELFRAAGEAGLING